MKFDTPAGQNPVDRMRVVGQPLDRIDGPHKVTGTATYAYEWHDATARAAYGQVIGAGIGKGRIASIDTSAAERAPGVLAVVTAQNAGKLGKGRMNTATLLGGPEVQHYHQAIALVVAETFEQARAAAGLVRVAYTRSRGRFSLEREQANAVKPEGKDNDDTAVGDFDAAFAAAPVTLDARYTTPDQSHAMMEPMASLAEWDGDKVTIWTSNQMIAWGKGDVARTLGIAPEKVRLVSPYIGGGFGGKLFVRADAVLAALGAKAAKRPVKVALHRPLIANNATHRPATLQRIRIGATPEGRITAIGHESWSGDLEGGGPEVAVQQTRFLYAGEHRITRMRLATLDLPEGNAMRAPGETPGMMALEIAMDEMADKLGIDPVEFRIRNDTQVDPEHPERPFSQRQFVECLRQGAEKFGWDARKAHGSVRDGRWLVGMGMAAGFRNAPVMKSGARARLDGDGRITIETDMTDIGTGSYTIIAQTAAEVMGVDVDRVEVKLGDSQFPVSAGSGGQWGANSATAGVYAACMKLREVVATRAELDPATAEFADGKVSGGGKSVDLADVAGDGQIVVEDAIEFGDLDKRKQLSTFAAHFAEVGVDVHTGETRVRRMLSVCAAGRILNPKQARSQIIGAMTMGIGAALSEELAVDETIGFFVNHDLAGYEVPVHADVPRQEVVFLDETDADSSPMKAKGVGELGLCGVPAAIANAIHNATGVRVREYPITLEKLIEGLPDVA
ncbi:aldehyde oxidoreductase molybdenum-binding subunit PaoC [Luteimonas terrae]|uniref:Xanthine dehydrogenase family protein molybdopterin-binding subunit n=1 Tax=Luteimonas terrae TaxID=1530191 RepID=A0A4R5UDN0_9GAMM|nr:aldehyde oxidoreductase molybdenum-binding subunit PaoC [Luteimonas terrae]TDK33395.1 xanthine dehydrogenase family protein molybdopterin-binding subunit [Luteimonas terrae]